MSSAELYSKLAAELLVEAAATDDEEERARLTYEALSWQVKAAEARAGDEPDFDG